MTFVLLSNISKDGMRICELECEKFSPYQAVVYDFSTGDWRKSHESNPTWDIAKATQAYRRFVRKYIVKGE